MSATTNTQRPYEYLNDEALRAHYESVLDQGEGVADELRLRAGQKSTSVWSTWTLADIASELHRLADSDLQSLVTAWSTHGGLISAELARRATQKDPADMLRWEIADPMDLAMKDAKAFGTGFTRTDAKGTTTHVPFADMLKANNRHDGPSPGDEVLIRATVHSNDGKTVWFLTGGADDPECSVSCVPIMRVISATPPWKPAAAEDWAGPSTTSGFDRLLRVNTGPEMAVHSGPRMWVPKEDGPLLDRLLKDIAEEPDDPFIATGGPKIRRIDDDDPGPEADEPEDFSMFTTEQLKRAREGEIAQHEEFLLMRGLDPLRAARVTLRTIRMLDGLITQRKAAR